MGNDKSKSRGPPPSAKQPVVSRTVDQASKIKSTVSRLEQRRDFIDKKMINELKQAKVKSKRGDKQGALSHLKRKKMYEKEVAKINNGILSLEQQVMSLEGASVTVDIVNAMGEGAKAMKAVQAGIDVDAVADLQDEIADMSAQQDEVDEALAQPLGGFEDESELENELAELEAAGLEEELSALPSVPKPAAQEKNYDTLPVAPSHAPIADDDDAAALRELEAEMAA